MCQALANYLWRELLDVSTADDAVALVENLVRAHVLEVSITIDRRVYGWVNDRCKSATAAEVGLFANDLEKQ